MRILSIETSCDETGIAIVEASGRFSNPKFKVLKNLVSSQIKIHRPFGGVVPGLAKREHIKNLPILLKKLLDSGFRIPDSIDLIAVTVGPGLEPALWTGITFAKALTHADKTRADTEKSPFRSVSSLFKSVPLVGVNHLEGHLYSFLLPKKTASSKLLFPAVALSVSGGHTVLLLMKDLKTWKRLGETKDDAAGEAFDKVARMLRLPYPGGPEIEKIASKGNPEAIDFPRPMLSQKNYDFSFSGLKTSVFYYLRDRKAQTDTDKNTDINGKSRSKSVYSPHKSVSRADIAASFQQAVIDVLVRKTMRAAGEYGARSVILCGGVAANKKLRNEFKKAVKNSGMGFLVPDMEYNNDNAAMIAAAAYMGLSRRKKYKLEADGDLNI